MGYSFYFGETVALIIRKVPSISPDDRVSTVSDFFLKHPETDFLPVISDDKAVGIVWRRDLMDRLAQNFGHSLNHRKPVKKIMDKSPIVVDEQMPLVALSHLITEYQGVHRGDAFLITDHGRYCGAATFFDLLRQITQLQIQNARYANPLSGLPGNVPIQQKIESCLSDHLAFTVIYVDVDHFKAYNDYYSFEQGDGVIRLISESLQENMTHHEGFLGHIGGDDFLVILSGIDEYQLFCNRLLNMFKASIVSFYSEEDQARGGIQAINRQGESQFFPMMSLSLGVLLVHPNSIDQPQQLARYATLAKKKAKSAGGNAFVVVETHTMSVA